LKARFFFSLPRSPSPCSRAQTAVSLQQEDGKKYYEWSVDDVAKWAAREVKFDHDDTVKLRGQKIDGASLPSLSKLDLERYGIPGGPASKLVAAVNKLMALEGFLLSFWDLFFSDLWF